MAEQLDHPQTTPDEMSEGVRELSAQELARREDVIHAAVEARARAANRPNQIRAAQRNLELAVRRASRQSTVEASDKDSAQAA